MAPRTVQELFNLKPEELNALTVLSGLEGYRGGRGEDVAAVAANVLARRLSGNWGGIDIRNIVKSPGQYEAVFDYSMQQLADPKFGAQKLGGEEEFNRIRNIINDPAIVGEQFTRSKGAQSFRGVSAYGNKKPTDYMPVPGKSNFYFNPLQQEQYKKGVSLFGQAAPANPASPPKATASSGLFQGLLSALTGNQPKEASVKDLVKQELMGQILKPPAQSNLMNPFQMLLNIGVK